MAYVTIEEVQKILHTDVFDYPASIDSEVELASAVIDGALAGVYALRFDDTANYASVPIQIKWIAALLVGWQLWDGEVVLEGQTNNTAAGRWEKKAMEWLEAIKNGSARLTLEDGSLVSSPASSIPRSYPDGVRTKADSADNDPLFTRAQAGNW